MSRSFFRTFSVLLLVSALAGFPGCKSSSVEASGQSSAADVTGPPTFNELFQARNPRICAQVTSVPNASQAAALVQCEREAGSRMNGFTPILFLATDVTVQIGSPRDFMLAIDAWPDIDTKSKIYPLRGSATGWTCGYARDSLPYLNCNRDAASPKGTGACWHTVFNDWKCSMSVGGGGQEMRVKGPTTY